MKDALGHGSNGRTGAKPIPNSPYHAKSSAELHYIIKDASEAEQASRGMTAYNPNGIQRSDTSGKYADQINDAASVLGYRSRGGLSDHPTDVASRAAVSNASPKSDPVPTHDGMSGGYAHVGVAYDASKSSLYGPGVREKVLASGGNVPAHMKTPYRG